MVQGIGSLAGSGLNAAVGRPAPGFSALLDGALGKVNAAQVEASHAVQAAAVGKGSLEAAVVATEKADLELTMAVEVRNKLLTAYQSVMNMQL